MDNPNFNLDRFRAEVFTRGLARKNRFEVMLPSIAGWTETAQLVSAFCYNANFAPLSITSRSMQIQGPRYIRGTNVNYGDAVNFTFLVDREMEVRRYFETWMNQIIEPATFNVGYFNEYAKDIEIFQLDEEENVTYHMILKDAYPSVVGVMDLNQGSISEMHTLNVTFVYRYWESYDIKNTKVMKPEISGPAEKLISWATKTGGVPNAVLDDEFQRNYTEAARYSETPAGAVTGYVRKSRR
jgi:hypothetical protein